MPSTGKPLLPPVIVKGLKKLLSTHFMLIAQISDTHISPSAKEGPSRRRWLERCISAINDLDPQPDTVIHTGDLTHKAGDDEFAEGLDIISKLKAPIFLAPGNRDERNKLRELFPDRDYLDPKSPYVQYAVEHHDVRLIALDTITVGDKKGEFCNARVASLRSALDGDKRPTAIFMHHPPFDLPVPGLEFQYNSRADAARMIGVLNGHGNVIRVFCGHAHRQFFEMLGDIPVSTLPSIAVDLRFGEYPAEQANAPLFQLHRYAPENGFTTETLAA